MYPVLHSLSSLFALRSLSMYSLIQHINANHPYGDSSAPCPQHPHSGVTPSDRPYAVLTRMFLVQSYFLHSAIPASGNASLRRDISFAKCSVLSYAFEKSTSSMHMSFSQYLASSSIIFFIINGSVTDLPARKA